MSIQDLPTLREKVIVQNSLLCLLKGIQRRVTTVELRNESEVYGKIDYVDAYMNTTMSDVIFTDPYGKQTKMEVFYVRGKNIRYVQIPDDVNILRLIKKTLDGPRNNMLLRNKPKETVVGSSHPYGPLHNKLRQSKEESKKRGEAYLQELLEKKRIAKLTTETENNEETIETPTSNETVEDDL